VPSITEVIFALGKESLLVGNTIYCDYPEGAKKIYKVGDFINPSLEKIVALRPDIVFLTLPAQKIIQEKLNTLKIKTFVSQPKDFETMLDEIKEIGRQLGAEKRACSLSHFLQEAKEKIRFPPIKVYIEISPQPIISIGKKSFLSDILEKQGLKNIFSDIEEEYPIIRIEDIIKRDPEVVLILHPLSRKEEVKKRLGLEKVKAVQSGQIIDEINPDLLLRPGPRIIEGLKMLHSILSSKPGHEK